MVSTDVYSIVRNKLKSRELSNTDIDLSFDEVEQEVKNYCCISAVPDALKYTMSNMIVDLLNYEYEINRSTADTGVDGIDIADVTSFKEGDTSIQLGQSGAAVTSARKKALSSHKPSLDDILMNYREQLNRYRRIF